MKKVSLQIFNIFEYVLLDFPKFKITVLIRAVCIIFPHYFINVDISSLLIKSVP